MENLLVLNIESFNKSVSEADFYANYFSRHLKKNRQKISSPHKHDFFLVVLFVQGTGQHEIDFKTYPISKGSVFILKPGQMHHWTLSEDIEGYIFFHSQAFWLGEDDAVNLKQFPFFSSSYNPPSIQLNETEQRRMTPFFEMIVHEAANDDLMRYQKIMNLIHLVYIELSRLYLKKHVKTAEPMSRYGLKLLAFEQCVEAHYKDQKTAKFYADALHVSTRHLTRISKEMLG